MFSYSGCVGNAMSGMKTHEQFTVKDGFICIKIIFFENVCVAINAF